MAFHDVGAANELWDGEMRGVVVAGVTVLLVAIDGVVHGYEDRCAHLRLPLSTGSLQGGVLTCAAHGWTYDARCGAGVNPRSARLRRFPVQIRGDRILVDIGEAGDACDDGRPVP